MLINLIHKKSITIINVSIHTSKIKIVLFIRKQSIMHITFSCNFNI